MRETQSDNVMENTKRKLRHGYACFINNFTITKAKFINIDHNLPHCIYISM